MSMGWINIRGARQHNLKNIDLDLPRHKMIVITGLSGSGKSTLAFDTLYAEGRRRYVESLSAYARQFLERLEKPDVDVIEGLSPAIAIEQKFSQHNPRSTVGTVTEIYDYLRLLYAGIGTPHCHKCGNPIEAQTLDEILEQIMALEEKTRIIILAPMPVSCQEKMKSILRRLRKDGFSRVRLNGEIMELEAIRKLDKEEKPSLEVVIDRLIIKEGIRNRLADSLELALGQSDGIVEIYLPDGKSLTFSEKAACISCKISYGELTPAAFSFNSPLGACPVCDGTGTIHDFDPNLIIPDKGLSLREGAVAPWARKTSPEFIEFLENLTGRYGTDIYTPLEKLPEHFINMLLNGSGTQTDVDEQLFEGIIPLLRRLSSESADNDQSRSHQPADMRQYISSRICGECHGSRLNSSVRSVKVAGLAIHQVTAMPLIKCRLFFQELPDKLQGKARLIALRIIKEITERLGFLENLGLTYLTLDRSAQTLSGGESRRIRLATQIGAKLTGVLYVLDEPSIGLHQRDNHRLISALHKLAEAGNTVLVVEHDQETIMRSDYVVDLGPGAGVNGGQIMFSGTPEQLLTSDSSLTGKYLSGKCGIPIPHCRRSGNGRELVIYGASANTLKYIDVRFPLGCFICVTGVSGSGKSSLVLDTLYRAVSSKQYRSYQPAGFYQCAEGLTFIDRVIHIDQSPIGRTPRSNPGTYTGVLPPIRELFAKTADSRLRGYKSSRFSFNMKGGRCEACKGDGLIKIEMHFMPDMFVPCDVCKGARFNRETLEIRYRGQNIKDVLEMTINQGITFFDKIPSIRVKLETLANVGLGYVRIGQPANTLSGGEAQRIKLAKELSKKGSGDTLYILDEPTTGLHLDDIQKLLEVLHNLVSMGNTIVVIEHHLDIIKSADYIIDLGPEGGEDGGYLIGCGTPEEIALIEHSYTGQYLRKYL